MKPVFFLILINFYLIINAQEKGRIENVIHSFFDGMKNCDTNIIRSTLTNTCIIQTTKVVKDTTKIINEKVEYFLRSVAASKPGDLDERFKIKRIEHDSLIAQCWVPYSFYYKGKYSHEGNNIFILVLQNGAWKINYIIDTRKNRKNSK